MILAGDIGVGLGGIEWAARRFPKVPVVYVPGNHELFDIRIVCNPGGYPGENRRSGFRGDLVVSIG